MKILSVKFKNINSLAGEWEIDFTEQRFTDNGLFVITGKTGAGKSSILDAISLALFGKTPRVEITGQNNDVMTHGTNDCYSEIVFEVGAKKWKSSWKQERTRTGNLKPVNRQIADSKDEIRADQIRTCDSKIEEILGLTFAQFTKVVMLAQGSFAAFLQADNKDKGELLEQITGTEIYGEISKKVFERNRTEKEKLNKILIELETIKVLTAEEIDNLTNEITEFEKQKKQFDNDLQTIDTARKWLKDLSDLQQQINQATAKLPDLELKVQETKTAFEQSEIMLKKAKKEQENTLPILINVRELDTKIAEKEKLLTPVLFAINNLENIKNELSQKLEKQKNDLEKSQNTLNQKQEWANANAKYELLVGNYSAIENQHSQVIALHNDFELKNFDFESAKNELKVKNVNFQKSQTDFSEKENALNEKTREIEAKRGELSNILCGKELADYQTEKENITNFGTQIRNLIEVEKEISQNLKEIENYEKNIVSFSQAEKELTDKILTNKTAIKNLDEQINLLDENIKLTKTIQSLDDHRKSLEDGKACPLCGSLKHPFADGNEPKICEKETELNNLKTQFQTITDDTQQTEKTLAKLISDKENSQKNKLKEEVILCENQKKQKNILFKIKALKPDFEIFKCENQIILLEEIRVQKLNDYNKIAIIISDATDIEKSIKELQNEEIPQLQQAKKSAENAKTEAEITLKLAEQQVENKKVLLNDAETQLKENNDKLLQKFAEYGVENIEALKKCLTNWNTNRQETEDLKEQIIKFENAITLTNVEKTNNQAQISTKINEKQEFEKDKQKLYTERFDLFGEKLVENEEKRLNKLLEIADTNKTNAENEKTNANTELAKNQAIITEKEKELTEKREQKITEKMPGELQSEFDEKRLKSDELSQKIGANFQILNMNDENLKNSGKKLKNKEIQQQICTKWGSLNELIGSSDGKKYRNFAQALTFEYLIGLANRQLQKMSERYILKRADDTANPFDLSVIDKFQNCEERTAQNLSGGEKFIVSLSLALGLANMAGKNIKIDTMFIDEGFGTLDSDYLDTALSALSNLQNEGKLIGVISHLTELKERIATHIEVIPDSNGHSKIGGVVKSMLM